MTQTEKKFETLSNITRTDRMRLTTGGRTYTADVVSSDGAFIRIDAGQIADAQTGMPKGSFNASAPSSVTCGIQATASRDERTQIYEDIETFLADAKATVESYATTPEAE